MSRFLRALVAAALLSLVALLPAGPAEAEYMGLKVEVGGPATFVYIGGDPEERNGAAGICAMNEGVTVNFAPVPPTQDCPAVPTQAEVVTLAPPGGEPPAGPSQRGCTGATDGAATCVDFGDGNFILGDPPDDGHGELGICAGGSYFFVAGPDPPDGDAGAACPAAAPAPGGGGEPPPAPDGDADGVPDSSDRCPGTAAGTSDGCPPQNPTNSPSSTEGGSTNGGSQTTQQRPAEPAESPVLDITRNRLRVSRRGWVGIPLACRTRQTPCVGELRLTATRRTRDGRRARVVLARATLHVDAGDTAKRRVRLTRRGRELLERRNPLHALAGIRLSANGATVASRERLLLRRVWR